MMRDLSPEQLRQDVTVNLPLSVLLRLAETQPPAAAPVPSAMLGALPMIGADFHGGKYAGLSIEDGKPVALVLLSGEIEDVSWDKAVAWATERGASLPSRIDQLVLFKNLKSEFQEAVYWSGEQLADDAGYAWGQDFGYGYQNCWPKGTTGHACAVRRISIQ